MNPPRPHVFLFDNIYMKFFDLFQTLDDFFRKENDFTPGDGRQFFLLRRRKVDPVLLQIFLGHKQLGDRTFQDFSDLFQPLKARSDKATFDSGKRICSHPQTFGKGRLIPSQQFSSCGNVRTYYDRESLLFRPSHVSLHFCVQK